MIQPRGWLLVCDAEAAHVQGVSENAAELWPEQTHFIGAALRDLLGSDTAHSARNALSRASAAPRPALLPRRTLAGGGLFDLTVHAAGAQMIIEIEKASDPDFGALDRARALIDRLASTHDLERLGTLATRLMYSVLNWDCVSLVRFEPDGSGRALAQQKRPDWPNAEQDRTLLKAIAPRGGGSDVVTGLRLLSDAGAAPIALIGEPAPDLSLALLRAASADERARARQAKFAALLSLPIRVDGVLWGQFLAHDRSPRVLTMDERAVFEIFADFLSLSIEAALWRRAAAEVS